MKGNRLGAGLLAAVFLSCCVSLPAQDNERNKVRINQIKRDTAYIFGEQSMPTPDEAEEAASRLFKFKLAGWMKRQDPDRLKPIGDLDLFVRNCRRISAVRGETLVRILIYVPKDELCLPPVVPPQDSVLALSGGAAGGKAGKPAGTAAATPELLVAELLGQETLRNAVSVLRQRRFSAICDYGEVDYDTDMKLMAKSLLLVYDGKERIRALLDARRPDRINLGTGLKDSTANYRHCRAKWILLKRDMESGPEREGKDCTQR